MSQPPIRNLDAFQALETFLKDPERQTPDFRSLREGLQNARVEITQKNLKPSIQNLSLGTHGHLVKVESQKPIRLEKFLSQLLGRPFQWIIYQRPQIPPRAAYWKIQSGVMMPTECYIGKDDGIIYACVRTGEG